MAIQIREKELQIVVQKKKEKALEKSLDTAQFEVEHLTTELASRDSIIERQEVSYNW